MSTLGEKIKELRQENNLTQKKLAEMAGISEISVRKYESGDRLPKYDVVEKFSTIFNVQTDYILGRSDYRKFNNVILHDDFQALAKIIELSNNPKLSKLITNIVDTMFLTIFSDSKEGNLDKLNLIHDLYRNIYNLGISIKFEGREDSPVYSANELIKKQTNLINDLAELTKK